MGLLMVRELVRQGVEVDVYVPTYSFAPPAIEPLPGLRVIEHRSRWRWRRWYSSTKSRALFSGALSRTVSYMLLDLRLLLEHRRRPYDVVYQLSVTELFLLGRLRRFAPPIVVHPCTHAAGELRWHRAEQAYALQSERRSIHLVMRCWLALRARIQPRELSAARLVLGLSERFNELLHADYAVGWDRLRVVRTPVDLTRFTPDGPAAPSDKRTLLFVSRISTRKGVAEIVELSHRLSDLEDSVRLVVIGGPTQWSDYTAHLRELNPRVAEYRGHVPSDELPALMRSAAMLLVPSRYEPGSIAAAEALGCGLPVVLSDEVGNAEVVAGPHARFHRALDVDGLEAGVRSLLVAMDQEEVALRASARANAERAFAPETVVADLITAISRCCSAAAAPLAAHDVAQQDPFPVESDVRSLSRVS
jgi:glycosyltransferase involved in cell wall biosynthesis